MTIVIPSWRRVRDLAVMTLVPPAYALATLFASAVVMMLSLSFGILWLDIVVGHVILAAILLAASHVLTYVERTGKARPYLVHARQAAACYAVTLGAFVVGLLDYGWFVPHRSEELGFFVHVFGGAALVNFAYHIAIRPRLPIVRVVIDYEVQKTAQS